MSSWGGYNKGYWGEQLQNALGAFTGTPGAPSGAYLRDFRHAAKTFVSDSYALAPKYKFLFHTYFELNVDIGVDFNNLGILVKDVRLPSYRFNTHTMNQYNRKRVVQTKINYEPVDITFHDDNSNVINKLWYAYYTYYYKDAAKIGANPVNNSAQPKADDVTGRNMYSDKQEGDTDWGFIGEPSSDASGTKTKLPFFKAINIYGFNQHNFTQYRLINPIILSFNHDTYDYDQGNGVMTNRMQIDYETVQYFEGSFSGQDLPRPETGNFGDAANYDRELSPITVPGANGKILGQGGFIDGIGGIVNAFGQRPPNLMSAIKIAGATYNNLKTYNPKTALKNEAENLLRSAIGQIDIGRTTRNQTVTTPTKQATPTRNGAGSPTVTEPQTRNQTIDDLQPVTVTGRRINPPAGAQIPTQPTPNRKGPI